MKIIAHRGYWEEPHQQNSLEAIFLGLVFCDGVEIDLRMYDQKIIISHDSIKSSDKKLYLKDVLKLSLHFPEKLWALNIKEDGLFKELRRILTEYESLKYFCFDTSFPETVKYIANNLKIASRISDLEIENDYISSNADFYLIDFFLEQKKQKVKMGKSIFLISSELHAKDFDIQQIFDINTCNDIYLCTDNVSELC